jgi:hypothetical protein
VAATAGPHLDARALRAVHRAAAAAAHEASALRAATDGERRSAGRAALATVRRRPRLLADRRLATLLVDSVGDGAPGNALRRLKRRLIGYR